MHVGTPAPEKLESHHYYDLYNVGVMTNNNYKFAKCLTLA
jgi:hypothetical protein